MSKQATRSQLIAINKQLEQICKKLPDGYCEFADDWNDARVASVVGCLPSSVVSVRRDLFG